jgi:hypothetical protein
MEKVKYTQIFYPGYFCLKTLTPFYLYDNEMLLGMVAVLNHHIGIQMIDLNSKINVDYTQEKIRYKYSLRGNNSETGLLISKEGIQSVNFDTKKHIPDYNLDELAVVYEWTPKPRFLQNVYVTELLIARFYHDKEDRNKYDLEAKILELFSIKYREVTNDVNIKVFSDFHSLFNGAMMNYIVELNKAEEKLTAEQKLMAEREVAHFATNTINIDIRDVKKSATPILDISSTTSNFYACLMAKTEIDLAKKVLNKAKEEIDMFKNYKYALLELFIYSESFTTHYLIEKKLQKGISSKKIDQYEVPFSYLLNIELPLFIQDFSDEWKNIIGELNWVRTKRNSIVHEGAQVSLEEANKAYKAVNNFINKMKELI